MFVRRFGGWLALAVAAAAVAVGLCGWLAAASASPGAPMALVTGTDPVTSTSSSVSPTAPTTRPISTAPKSSTPKKSSPAATSSAPRTSTRASSAASSFFEPPPEFSFFPPETDPVTSVHRAVITRSGSKRVETVFASGTSQESTPSTCVSQLVQSQTLPLGTPCAGVTQVHIVAEDNTKKVAPIAFSVLAAGAGILLRVSSRGVRAARHR